MRISGEAKGRSDMLKRVEVVAAVIRNESGEYLATQRGYGAFKGKWEFPGGKVEVGESRENALVREIREELGATIAIESFIRTIEYDYESFHLTMHCYFARVCEGEIRVREHMDARWLSVEELASVDWIPADVGLLGDLS